MHNLLARIQLEDINFQNKQPVRVPEYKINWTLFFFSEVECEVSSQVEYSLQAIWGVSIRELHLALWKPWSALRDASLNGTLLQGHAQYFTPAQRYNSLLILIVLWVVLNFRNLCLENNFFYVL